MKPAARPSPALLVLLVALPLLALPAGTASAATYTIDVGTDTHDVSPGNGTCADATGHCSLRAAIEEGNASAGDHVINFTPGIVVTVGAFGSLPSLNAKYVVNGNLATIDGQYVQGSSIGYGCLSLQDSGTAALGHANGAAGSTVMNLSIVRCNGDGISSNGHGYTYLNNRIGVDPTGLVAMPNSGNGIRVTASAYYPDGTTLQGIYDLLPLAPAGRLLADPPVPDRPRERAPLGRRAGQDHRERDLRERPLRPRDPRHEHGRRLRLGEPHRDGRRRRHRGPERLERREDQRDVVREHDRARQRHQRQRAARHPRRLGRRPPAELRHGEPHRPRRRPGRPRRQRPVRHLGRHEARRRVPGPPNPSGTSLLVGPTNVIADNQGTNNDPYPDDVSAEANAGIVITGSSAKVKVLGNLIGVAEFPKGTPDPSAAWGNAGDGILVTTSDNVIGGSSSEANVIAANLRHGIVVKGSGTAGTDVRGNSIGLSPSFPGQTTLGNGVDGIHVDRASASAFGGANAGDGNVVAYNKRNGIALRNGSSSSGWANLMQRNLVYGNGKGARGPASTSSIRSTPRTTPRTPSTPRTTRTATRSSRSSAPAPRTPAPAPARRPPPPSAAPRPSTGPSRRTPARRSGSSSTP